MVRNSALGSRIPGQGCSLPNHGWSLWHHPGRAGHADISKHLEKKPIEPSILFPKSGRFAENALPILPRLEQCLRAGGSPVPLLLT